MTLRHLKIFSTVCQENCNTTRAAEKLHMTQPAISLAIKELEEYYSVVLFDRVGRRLHLTEAGNQLLQYATSISALFTEMEDCLLDWRNSAKLRVGASVTIGSLFLPFYVKSFLEIHPNADIRVLVAPSMELEEKILTGDLDFALTEGTVHHSNLHTESYLEDYLTIICAADRGYHHGQVLTQAEFKKQRILLREQGSGTRDLFDHVTEAAGFSISPTWEAISTTALLHAAMNGLGMAVLPHRLVSRPIEEGKVVAIKVEGLTFRRTFSIVYHPSKYLTNMAKEFISLCREYEEDYPIPHFQ